MYESPSIKSQKVAMFPKLNGFLSLPRRNYGKDFQLFNNDENWAPIFLGSQAKALVCMQWAH